MGGTEQRLQLWMAVDNFLTRDQQSKKDLKAQFTSCIAQGAYKEVVDGCNDKDAHAHWHLMDKAVTSALNKNINKMLDFYFVGIFLGLAYAHQHSGDTVASVMVGGLKTLLNGVFQVSTVSHYLSVYNFL